MNGGSPVSPLVESLRSHAIDAPIEARLTSALGVVVLMLIAWAWSTNRKIIPWRVVLWGVVLQVTFALFVLRTDFGLTFFSGVNEGANKLIGFAQTGLSMVFGDLVSKYPLAFSALPAIIFFGALMSVLYHLRIMQAIVWVFDVAMRRTMRTSGAETLASAANIFVGQTEAPLLIRPYVDRMTRSELMAVMVGGFANVAGGVFVVYVSLFGDRFPDIAGHLLTCSILSAPSSLLIAKLMVPEEETPVTAGMQAKWERTDAGNVVDAAARGAWDGMRLTVNVVTMLVAFVALVALANALLGWVGGFVGLPDLSMQMVLGKVMAPLAWVLGVPSVDAVAVGELIGTKTVLNEFVAYNDLSVMIEQGRLVEPRSVLIASYALCGFANISSVAIQIGGISLLAPGRRADLVSLGWRAMVGGSLSTFMCAAVAGIVA
jgi:CNT family concentrative nucleoside transporter